MNAELQMHDLVAITEDIAATHFANGTPLTLRCGQIGTVVMTYDGSAFEVEFADAQGRAFALLPVAVEKLLQLHDAPAALVEA
ncbi:DUF4926 domain-containing protein [bacterium]|nr:DUF4926 domain-containing protein [bacterium]